MKFYFSVDALSLLGNKAWRLQEDKSWRKIIFGEPLQAGDAKLTDNKVVAGWANVRLQADKSLGLKVKGKTGLFDFMVQGIFAHVILHRLSAVALPNKEQMLLTIAHAEVGTPWLLYLDLAGSFRMLHSEQAPIIGNPEIAVRGEIASSAEYVGDEAVKNTDMMDTLFHQFVAGWFEHLKTSRLAVFVPDTKDITPLDDCIEKITSWKHE